MSISNKMTELANAIRNKSGISTKLSIDGMINAINELTNSASDKRTILYMPFDGNLKMYGDLSCTRSYGWYYFQMMEEQGQYDLKFSDGVFDGQKSLEFVGPTYDDEGNMIYDEFYGAPVDSDGNMIYPTQLIIPIYSRFLTGDFTFDFWFKPSDHNYTQRVKTGDIYIAISQQSSQIVLSFQNSHMFNINLMGWDGDNVSVNFTNSDWIHICWVKKDTTCYYFFNGQIIKTRENVSLSTDVDIQQLKERGGISEINEGYFAGKFAHYRVLNYALWTENFTPSTKQHYQQFKK